MSLYAAQLGLTQCLLIFPINLSFVSKELAFLHEKTEPSLLIYHNTQPGFVTSKFTLFELTLAFPSDSPLPVL